MLNYRALKGSAAFLCCLAGTSVSFAASAPKVSPHMAVLQAGQPGIVICEPKAAPADTEGSNFGSGCALWLQLVVGGLPSLGETPTWESLTRARAEMHRADLQLSPAQAPALVPFLGVTHAAVGTLNGTAAHETLTYTLRQLPEGTPVGAPITLSGTQEQIVAKLPGMAQTLAARMGVSEPDIPASTGLTPGDLQMMGRIRRPEAAALTVSEQTTLDALAPHSPLASLLALNCEPFHTQSRYNAAVRALLAQAGSNTLVWSAAAILDSAMLQPHAADLSALAARFPGSYNLALAEAFRFRFVGDGDSELRAAERIVRDAPRNPDGWLTYAYSLSNAASFLRQGRVYNELTPSETETLGRLYPQWESAAQRAAHLDPAYGKAWLRLAEAATFNSNASLANYALQTALARDNDKPDVYGWALQMYQPKWNDDPAMLTKIAQMAAAEPGMNASVTLYIAGELASSGSPELRRQVLTNFITRRRAFIASHPDDGTAHWGLASVLEESGDKSAALTEYHAAETLMPDNAVVRCERADEIYHAGDARHSSELYRQAIALYQEAVRIDPDYVRPYVGMGYCQKNLHQFAEANQSWETVLRLDPANGSAYSGLAEVLLRQNRPAEAVTDYQTAMRFGDYSPASYDNLISALSKTQQWDVLIATGEAALRLYTQGDSDISNFMANAYLEKKEWDNSLAMSQVSLALNANDAWAHENIAEAYLGAGRKEEAKAEWRKVLTLKDTGLKKDAQKYLDQNP